MDVDTGANKDGIYRFRQDGASGSIFRGNAHGQPSPKGTRWFVQIDGEGNSQGFDTKAEAEEYAEKRTRAGYATYGEEPRFIVPLGLAYEPLGLGEADIKIRTTDGEFVKVRLNATQRARLLRMLADDFAADVLHDCVIFRPEE